MAKNRVVWVGPVPGSCVTCGEDNVGLKFYDAKTSFGYWAIMCVKCFHFGPGLGKLGIGLGQEYTKKHGQYVKTGG
jgi:hypothetical protein